MTPHRLLRAGAAALALALVLAPLASVPAHSADPVALSPDDQAAVQEATAYLDGLGELKGRFVQTDPRGQVSTGVLYLKRPGLARFAYDPPSNLLVIADGRSVYVINPQLKSYDRYPIGYTPLSLILAKHVRLDEGVQVTHVTRTDTGFTITARDARGRQGGQVVLTFKDHPLRISDWVMTDAQGQSTTIRLSSLAPTSGLEASLFAAPDYYAVKQVPPPPAN